MEKKQKLAVVWAALHYRAVDINIRNFKSEIKITFIA